MSGGSLKNPKTKYAKPPVKKHTTFSHLGGLEGTGWSRGLKRENVYKVEQDVGRVGGKTVSTSYIPLFFLAEPRRSSFPFLLPKKKKIVFLLIHRKVWLGCFNLAYLGVFWSFLLRSRGPRSSAGTSSALGKQGQKMLRRRLRPGGLSARGRAARRRAPAGRKLSPPRAQAAG